MMEKYTITAENRLSLCDEISAAAAEFCGEYIEDRKEVLRYRFALEECLLNWLTEDAVGKTLTFDCGKKVLRKPYLEATLSGEAVNPNQGSNSHDFGEYGASIMRSLGLSPLYSYRNGVNLLRFDLKYSRHSTFQQLIMIIIASLLVGFIGTLLPEAFIASLRDYLVTPIYNTFFDLLGCVAGPMIFLSVVWGVYGIGDTSTLSRIGKRMLLTFCAVNLIVCTCGLLMVPFFDLHFSFAGSGGMELSEIISMLLDIVPANIIEPFADGNTLQIIFMGFAVGIALLFLGKRTEGVAIAIDQINALVQFFMEFISKLVPYVVFFVIVGLLWSDSLSLLLTSWRLLAVLSGAIIVTCIGYYTYTSLRLKVNMADLMKKCLPSFLVAFVTASSAATFSTNIDICRKQLGIDDAISGFGVPLAMVIHNPIASLNNLAVALFFASYYQVDCSVSWLMTAVFLSALLAISTPPIPGGGTLAYTLLLAQLGIPAEALGVALTVDILSDFIITAAEMYCLLPALTNIAHVMGMLDEKLLRRKSVPNGGKS